MKPPSCALGATVGRRLLRRRTSPPRPGSHRVEYQLVVHAIAEGDDGQHRLGFQQPLDQGALGHQVLPIEADEDQPGKGNIHQRQQLVEATTGADHLTQRRQCTLQPLKVGGVTRDCQEGLAQTLAHFDNPVRRS